MAEKNHEAPFVGPYVLQNVLGKGQTGIVKLGVHSASKKKVAIKIVDRTKLAPHILTKVEREIAIMKLINHPNILGLYDVYENRKNLYLVLEYVGGGELFEYLVKKKRLQVMEARRFFRQIVSAVDFCHHHLICHRDLKPENLLLDNKKNVKIADFGMASVQPSNCMLETSCGAKGNFCDSFFVCCWKISDSDVRTIRSPHYAAPEVIKGVKYDGRKADVWSCGVILYALVVGCLPFDDDNLRQLLEKVKKGVFVIPPFVSNDCRDLLLRMIRVDTAERLTMSEVRQHKFLQSDDLPPEPPVQQVVETEPLNDEYDIDPDILNSMTSLGCFKDKVQLTERLLSQEDNLERVIYFLLMDRKNKISYQEEEMPAYHMLRLEDPPRKRGESRLAKDDSETIGDRKPREMLTKQRAMTYHSGTLNNRSPPIITTEDRPDLTTITPPGSPWRSRLTALKKSVGAGIFTRRRSQSSSDDTGKLDSSSLSTSTPDIALKRSWFTSFLFHTPGNIQPFMLKIKDRSTEALKMDLENALSLMLNMTHFTISPTEWHVIYKKSKGLYHRKTLINVRYELSSYSKCDDNENYPVLLHVTFVNGFPWAVMHRGCSLEGSHRKFRKFCMYLANRLLPKDHTDGDKNGTDITNGVMSDESSPSSGSRDDNRRKTSLEAHSTENLLDSDDSLDDL